MRIQQTGIRLEEAARAELTTAFSEDIARLRRLEDKLAGQLTVVALLLGIVSVVGGLAVTQHNHVAMALIIGCYFWLVPGGLLSLNGSGARRLRLVDPVAAIELGHLDLERQLAADRLQSLKLNEAVGLQLSNILYAVQRCIVVTVGLLLVAGIVTQLEFGAAL